ncbi:MAG: acetyl-CoA carboxylase carboxyltransferase subunit alpha [Acidobacteria bacterium]|jgi:acetyl-CoA carboxylase carboxyl transferase subunit alpha|nr:MAG: acetyl-CoA carboxylase carboxyltransferase subunit alpha [Acidobacteriota bacterium]GIU81072.1 MAG: acetyl-coenzyme A carboxylase carboxyl transferase subunit alpha [Pyrinomonadaceae bacterium]
MSTEAFQRVLTARHPERPYTSDILEAIFENFVEIHGDRRFSDDPAIVAGIASIEGIETVVVGHQKGRNMEARKFRNFGMPKPEGYRKALRVMKLAEKFGRPVISFIDTPGAYPGIDAEERGQAEAIAYNLREMASLKTPVLIVVIGEGGSGGALAIGVGDRIIMMENAIYSVISPEGCAAILWKDASLAPKAAESLKLTASDLYNFGIVDEIIPEPVQWKVSPEPDEIMLKLKEAIVKHIKELEKLPVEKLLEKRYEKFRKMGEFLEIRAK